MINAHQLTPIFCQIDDFCKQLDNYTKDMLLTDRMKSQRGPAASLSISEIMTILIMFQMARFRDFKNFYKGYLLCFHGSAFPRLPTYERFVALMNRAIFPMTLFVQINSGKKTGIYYIDSTSLPVCELKRSRRHKTFESVAEYGKTSVGWFFGLKLHIVINDKGELIAFKITKGNKHDSKAAENLLSPLNGLAFGDKGYLGKKLFETLFEQGVKLITRKRKNMKKQETTSPFEKQLLNQRNMIETVIGHLKHHYHVWHTRHRSVLNAMTHLVAALATYTIEPLKISAIKLLAV